MISLSIAESQETVLRPRIAVMGVGGAGGNAIDNMIRSQLEGCEFIAANTDAQALQKSLAGRKLQLGMNHTRGLGAGSKPEVGRAAAEEQLDDLLSLLNGSDMLFITAGMGGGTGTGAAPVIARAAREAGILTVGVVTKPFQFEGTRRMQQAESGIADLQQYVDTLIVIPNQNLFRLANERTTFAEAFRMADEVLHSGVRGITDLMVMPGFMNLDFADVKTVMAEMGKAMMGTGEAEGEARALRAAEAAISNPLLDDVSLNGARGVLINITGGLDMTLFEVDQAANRIREEVDHDAQIKVGSTLSDDLEGRIRVSVIATGIDVGAQVGRQGSMQMPIASLRTQETTTTPRKSKKAAVTPTTATMPAVETPAQAPLQQQTFTQAAAPQAPATIGISMTQQAKPMDVTQPAAQRVTPPSTFQSQMQQFQTEAPQEAAPQPQVLAPQMDMLSAEPQATAAGPRLSTPAMQPLQQPQTEAQRAPMMRPIQAQATERPQTSAPTEAPRYTHISASNPAPMAMGAAGGMPGEAGNKRAESLFRRITGFGLIRPSAGGQPGEETQATATPQATKTPTTQARLAIEAERNALNQEDEDTLDIPAFLRQQSSH